ncbi:MAG: hypothetical protein WAT66_11835 [Actinomycetota bacterium]
MRRIALAALALVVLAACDGGPAPRQKATTPPFPAALTASPYRPTIDPSRFSTKIDNPYFPLTPGVVLTYRGTSEGEQEVDVVTVTRDTKVILGVTCVVVRDEVKVAGETTELTFDWYAQDRNGNVWYFGEDSRETEGGKIVSREGSWEAGKSGAQPGIIMPATRTLGLAYRQEYYAGHAEDQAKIVSVTETVNIGYGSFERVVVTEDSSRLDPKLVERKYYAAGIGLVFEKNVKGPQETLELASSTRR